MYTPLIKDTKNYAIKEDLLGYIGEWLDEGTDEDRRDDIEFEIADLSRQLVALEPEYKGLKMSELYEKLREEITSSKY